MENQVLVQVVIAVVGLLSGLVGSYVGLQNRALLAEVRKELAELENRIITRINGTYLRTEEGELRDLLIQERLNAFAEELRRRSAAGL